MRDTDLAWTILMPGRLTLEPSKGTLDPEPGQTGPTSRELVADVITAVVAADVDAVARLDLPFTDGNVPIAEALVGHPDPDGQRICSTRPVSTS